MILTDEKIPVTWAMMVGANMTKGAQIGIPVDPSAPTKGLRWKDLLEATDADYNAIEEYFLSKTASVATPPRV